MSNGSCASLGNWDDQAQASAREIRERLERGDLDRIRYAWVDQHGLVRGKTLLDPRARRALDDGLNIVGTTMLKDSSDMTAWPVFEPGAGFGSRDFEGASDLTLVPDPTTFVTLPWSPGTGWVLCEAHLADGRIAPYDTRALLRRVLAMLAKRSWRARMGLEVEFHIFRLLDAPVEPAALGRPVAPPVALLNSGYRLLTEQRFDALEPVIELVRKPLLALGLPIESIEIELGPSQVEFVFSHAEALQAADRMILFRHATKQLLRRHGYLASFMCLPNLPGLMASGWHLHQSLVEADGANLFAAGDEAHPLSTTGRGYLGGLLAHAAACCSFSTPTVNGYRRFRPNALAPDRVTWGLDNRGAMLRVIRGTKPGETRIENRIGEPAANPYLYFASQIAAGLDGCDRALAPGEPVDRPYAGEHARLPRTLDEALGALDVDEALSKALGRDFIDYHLHIKRAELSRFRAEVSAWEHREYFDMF
ncbi:MAG: glutamine synthetase family protein [Burkholderiaceae bacterium]